MFFLAAGKFAEQSTLEAIFFGSPQLSASHRLQRSLRIHSTISSLLLRSLDSLQKHYEELNSLLTTDDASANDSFEKVNCASKLTKLIEILGQLHAEEDILQMANTQIAQLCAANVVLWSQFISMSKLKPEIELYLATIHAKLRRRRFLEAFMTASFPKKRVLSSNPDSKSHSHSSRAAIIRQSDYLKNLPVLPLQQTDLDETSMEHPIIFEDLYSQDITEDDMIQREKESSQNGDDVDRETNVNSETNGVSKNESSVCTENESASSLSTIGSESRKKMWSVKKRGKQTLKNEVADFGKKQPVTVIGVRWRRSDDDFTISPRKATSSLPPTPIFAESPPPINSQTPKVVEEIPKPDYTPEGTGHMEGLIERSSFSRFTDLPAKFRSSLRDSTSPVNDHWDNDEPLRNRSSSFDDYLKSQKIERNIRRSISSGCMPLSPLQEDRSYYQQFPERTLPPADTGSLSSLEKKESSSEDLSADFEPQKQLTLNFGPCEDNASLSSSSKSSKNSQPDYIGKDLTESKTEDEKKVVQGFWNERLTLQEMLNDMEAIDEVDATAGACLEHTQSPEGKTSGQFSVSISDGTMLSGNGSFSIQSNAFTCNQKFVRAKEILHKRITNGEYRGIFCSDHFQNVETLLSTPAELPLAYFCTQLSNVPKTSNQVNGIDLDDIGTGFVGRPYNSSSSSKTLHLVVCVHGLEGNCCDLRLVRAYLELLVPDQRFKFLMSTSNQSDTFTDVDKMADNLVHEVQLAYNSTRSRISRISFIGHSLGTLIIRAALSKPAMGKFRERFFTFLSLSGPHLGTLYSTSSLVNMGMWLIQKWKKSSSLLQMSLRDHQDVRQTFLYKLSLKPGLQYFKNVLFVGSHQDHYVPYHSARIELCRVAAKDNSAQGIAYREMISNILKPLVEPTSNVAKIARFDCYFSLPSGADNLIGRAAHVAVLDSDLFLEKFFTVIARRYFV